MNRRITAIILLVLALCLATLAPLLAFTTIGSSLFASTDPTASDPTAIPYTPTPTPTPKPVLTVQGTPPQINVEAVYLTDMDTGNTLDNVNGTTPLPMASTTKVMTALIAIQTGNLSQVVPIKQDAVDEYTLHDGSNAGLKVGERYTLKDLLYALLLPSGDDAAVAIADDLGGGSIDNFVQRMNLFAYRLHLFQTHYADPDGLNWHNSPDHYTTASDLTHLAKYALANPLFAQMVQTQTYSVPATANHPAHTWTSTNLYLLSNYPGMQGVKTGHTDAAGWCLAFAATRNGHHLVGVVLNSPGEMQRNLDIEKLLNWGFSLPLLPPPS